LRSPPKKKGGPRHSGRAAKFAGEKTSPAKLKNMKV